MEITYALEPDLSAEAFVDVLHRSALARRRPVTDMPRIETMLRQADLIVTAREAEGRLVGVSRAISDFSYCTYLSDLAVDATFQRRGIGRTLVNQTHATAGRHTALILLSAPDATSYYPRIGMRRHELCWVLDCAAASD